MSDFDPNTLKDTGLSMGWLLTLMGALLVSLLGMFKALGTWVFARQVKRVDKMEEIHRSDITTLHVKVDDIEHKFETEHNQTRKEMHEGFSKTNDLIIQLLKNSKK